MSDLTNYNWSAEWLKGYHAYLEKHGNVKYAAFVWWVSPNEQDYPDFNSSHHWFGIMRFVGYAAYISAFRLRHPIMYFLWYRWWLFRFTSPELRQHLAESTHDWKRPFYCFTGPRNYWAAFAMYHPVVFLVRLLWLTCYQFFVQLFSAPVESVCPWKGQVAASGDVVCVEDEFAQKGDNVPPE